MNLGRFEYQALPERLRGHRRLADSPGRIADWIKLTAQKLAHAAGIPNYSGSWLNEPSVDRMVGSQYLLRRGLIATSRFSASGPPTSWVMTPSRYPRLEPGGNCARAVSGSVK
jgi:hypothetical protein